MKVIIVDTIGRELSIATDTFRQNPSADHYAAMETLMLTYQYIDKNMSAEAVSEAFFSVPRHRIVAAAIDIVSAYYKRVSLPPQTGYIFV